MAASVRFGTALAKPILYSIADQPDFTELYENLQHFHFPFLFPLVAKGEKRRKRLFRIWALVGLRRVVRECGGACQCRQSTN